MSAALAPDERQLLEQIADSVVARGVALPAMMFLETVAPMNMLSSSMLQLASPMWRMLLPASRIDLAAAILQRRESIPALLTMIDEREETRRRAARSPDADADDTTGTHDTVTADADTTTAARDARDQPDARATPDATSVDAPETRDTRSPS
ncbi:MAG: hypothetical protein DRQ55_01125 [Planctomycetota bacterium]|nr:MAG: hypothetical protein DRQ55_01125 [Planctomycetota bacterium]